VGHLDANGNFVNPTVPINDGQSTISGRSIINDRAVIPEAQEHIPATENIRALRAALNTLGDGFVEAIDDSALEAIAANQPHISEGEIMAKRSTYKCWKRRRDRLVWGVSDGKISTVVCCRSLETPI